jgi:hypothetical protein
MGRALSWQTVYIRFYILTKNRGNILNEIIKFGKFVLNVDVCLRI